MSTSGDNDEVLSRSSARAAPQPVAVAVPSGAGAAAGSGSIGPCETGSSTPRTEPRPQTTDHHVSPSDSSQPQPPAETTVTGASPTGAVHGLAPSRPTLTEIEGRMRDQIRRLQEARAAAMMAEIVDLQRERDLTMGRVRRLERSMAELQSENSTLRNIVGSNERGGGGGGGGKSDLVDHVVFLERNLLEEQLLTSDLRKKLQTADKQNASLLLRMRREGRVGEGKDRRGSIPTHLSPLAAQDQRASLKSRSLSDLNQSKGATNSSPAVESFEAPPQPHHGATPKHSSERLNEKPDVSLETTPLVTMTKPPDYTPPSTRQTYYSPPVRRYKLAAANTRNMATQTDRDSEQENSRPENSEQTNRAESQGESGHSSGSRPLEMEELPHDAIVDALASAKTDILRLQQEKQGLESRLSEEVRKRQRQKMDTQRKRAESLQLECSLLRDNLSEFSLWVRRKLQQFEEDLDIFRVVRALHQSLSKDLTSADQLRKCQERVILLETMNSHLVEKGRGLEDRYKQAKKELRLLREQVPPYSPRMTAASQRHPLTPTPHHHLPPAAITAREEGHVGQQATPHVNPAGHM